MKDSTLLKKLGKNIATIRKKNGFSQDRLYHEAGLSRLTLYFIESGKSDPKFTTIFKISKALKVSPSELIDIK